jgi:hypothetical protein
MSDGSIRPLEFISLIFDGFPNSRQILNLSPMVVKEALEHNEFLGKDTATVVPFHSFLSVTSTRDKQHAVLVLPPSSCVAGCPALVWCWLWPLALAHAAT